MNRFFVYLLLGVLLLIGTCVFADTHFTFESLDPILLAKLEVEHPFEGACAGGLSENPSPQQGADFFAPWTSWTSDDLDALTSCKKTPCKVKLSGVETSRLAGTAKENRVPVFLEIVNDRIKDYQAHGIRHAYEYAGEILEPWSFFTKQGFKTELLIPTESHLLTRKLDFLSSQARKVRQVLDVRTAHSENESVTWMRDIYTAHYFDSWGEWIQVRCDLKNHLIKRTHVLALDFDLLKDTDFFSKLARPRMRQGVKEQSEKYLREALKKWMAKWSGHD